MDRVNEQATAGVPKLNGKARSKAHLLTGTDGKINKIVERSQRNPDHLGQVPYRNQQTQRVVRREDKESGDVKKEASVSTYRCSSPPHRESKGRIQQRSHQNRIEDLAEEHLLEWKTDQWLHRWATERTNRIREEVIHHSKSVRDQEQQHSQREEDCLAVIRPRLSRKEHREASKGQEGGAIAIEEPSRQVMQPQSWDNNKLMQCSSSRDREGKNTACTGHVRVVSNTQRSASEPTERDEQKVQWAIDAIRGKAEQDGGLDQD